MPNNQDVTYFAKTSFRNQGHVFGIKTDDRRRHMYIVGKTGMGKTSLIENLVVQDIQRGYGIAYIDPHGDTAEKLIRAIPPSRINDVIYFNPSDQDFPVAFNVMERVAPEYRHLVASGLVGVFKKIWADSWGPRLEYILRNAILALLEYPGSTLLGVMRLLVDKEYRKRVVEKITDPVVKSFWVDEYTKWNDRVLQEVIAPIQNKVGQFLSSSLIRNIVGQTTSSFDVRDAMDSRKILIMNLSKGRIGEDNSALLGAMMITKIQLAAMGRVDTAEDERSDFYLYVDEFQNFATESFANILSEARKYHLNLILANQYILQIDEKVRDAIFGNAGTIVSFRVGATDAEFLEKEFSPTFLATDIVNLEKYNIYLKLMIDGISADAFSATTLPPIGISESDENASKVIRISRERYASKKQDVEDKIRRWTGMLTEEEKQVFEERRQNRVSTTPGIGAQRATTSVRREYVLRPNTPTHQPVSTSPSPVPSHGDVMMMSPKVFPKDNTEFRQLENRVMYSANCAICGISIEVPFRPDGKRPTFCREHFRSFQKTLSNASATTSSPEIRNEVHLFQGHDRRVKNASFVDNVVNQHGSDASDGLSKSETTFVPRSYVSASEPISLGQIQHIAPKTFKRIKPAIDFGEVRRILDSEHSSESPSDSNPLDT